LTLDSNSWNVPNRISRALPCSRQLQGAIGPPHHWEATSKRPRHKLAPGASPRTRDRGRFQRHRCGKLQATRTCVILNNSPWRDPLDCARTHGEKNVCALSEAHAFSFGLYSNSHGRSCGDIRAKPPLGDQTDHTCEAEGHLHAGRTGSAPFYGRKESDRHSWAFRAQELNLCWELVLGGRRIPQSCGDRRPGPFLQKKRAPGWTCLPKGPPPPPSRRAGSASPKRSSERNPQALLAQNRRGAWGAGPGPTPDPTRKSVEWFFQLDGHQGGCFPERESYFRHPSPVRTSLLEFSMQHFRAPDFAPAVGPRGHPGTRAAAFSQTLILFAYFYSQQALLQSRMIRICATELFVERDFEPNARAACSIFSELWGPVGPAVLSTAKGGAARESDSSARRSYSKEWGAR